MPHVEPYTQRNTRLYIFYWIFGLMGFTLFLALGYKQIVCYDDYIRKAEKQTLRRIVSPGARGDIYDRNGKLLVGNEGRFSAVVYFNEVRKEFREEYTRLKADEVARQRAAGAAKVSVDASVISKQARENILQGYIDKINAILKTDYKLDATDFNRHFSERMLLPLPLVKDLSYREHAILAERLPIDSPIQIFSDTSRYYPYGSAAAHALGFVGSSYDIAEEGVPGEDLTTYTFAGKVGRAGMEKAFDAELAGKSGAQIWVVDPLGFQYDNIFSVPAQKGKSIYSSLDINLQLAAENAMGARKGAIVVLDIPTGEVLTMVSRPAYNPNDLSPFITKEVNEDIVARGAWLNRATQGLYPPGSTFKIVTACAAFMTGVIDEDTIVECHGALKVGNRMFPCNKKSGHGEVNLEKAIAQSCNVYFYKVGLDAGIDAISAMAKDFGLDSSPGIELSENSWRGSIVPTPEYKAARHDGPWTGGDTANTSIGQGYLLQTPLQMACMVASFARGETRTRASIIHDPMRAGGLEYHGGEKLAISKEQHDAIVRGMVGAAEWGTSTRSKVEGVTSAAKSGTAQVRVEGRPLTLAWMVAFAPAENPKIAIAVMIAGEAPGDAAGGRTAGPVVKEIIKQYFGTDSNIVIPPETPAEEEPPAAR